MKKVSASIEEYLTILLDLLGHELHEVHLLVVKLSNLFILFEVPVQFKRS